MGEREPRRFGGGAAWLGESGGAHRAGGSGLGCGVSTRGKEWQQETQVSYRDNSSPASHPEEESFKYGRRGLNEPCFVGIISFSVNCNFPFIEGEPYDYKR